MDKTGAKKGGFMDQLVALFKNVWLKRGVAVLCWGYTGFLIWVAWLNYAYFLEFENPTPLFVLYVFVNIAALGLMIYTRRQVITQINVMLLPVIVFATFLLAFGNWYMILPPLCVVIAIFFISRANETIKTVLGTMYLLMYVVGGAAYITITLLMGRMSLTGVDLTLRDTSYEVMSPDGNYRIVRYVDKPTGERRTASYYVEDVTGDAEIPFGSAKRVLGCGWVVTTKYTSRTDSPVSWTVQTIDGEKIQMLNVEGTIKENPYIAEGVTAVVTSEESAAEGDTFEAIAVTAAATAESAGSAE